MRRKSANILGVLIAAVLLVSLVSGGVAAEKLEQPLVKSIVVKGNSIVDTAVIKNAILKTKVNEPINEQWLLDDLHSIYNLGYFQDAAYEVDTVLGGAQVIFYVLENPIVQEINFGGLSKVSFNEYKKNMKTQIGYILNVHDIWEDLNGLSDWITEEYGFLTRVADIQADVDGFVHVELAQTKLKDIIIEGNEKTKDFVIERELNFETGDPANVHQIDQSLRRVLMLGFFDEISRDFSFGENPDETVLTIDLKERKTGSATFGVAYSSTDKLVGFIEAADENFLGRGQRLNATLELGRKSHSYELGFYEPYIDKSGTSLGLNLYKRSKGVKDKQDVEGKLISKGGDLTLGKPFGEFSRGRLALKMENNEYDLPDNFIKEDKTKDYKKRSIGFGFGTNTIDHPYYPTEGSKNDVYLEFGTSLFGGDSQYAKLRLEHSKFFEFKDGGYVLAVRGLGGRLLAGQFEHNEKFAIGGPDTLRGYPLGGHDSISLRGDHMMVMNAEFRFPIVEKITGVLFTDWGATWNSGEVLNLDKLNNSFGLGVRLDTPLGLLRLDYGFGKDEQEARKGQFYFGIGQTF